MNSLSSSGSIWISGLNSPPPELPPAAQRSIFLYRSIHRQGLDTAKTGQPAGVFFYSVDNIVVGLDTKFMACPADVLHHRDIHFGGIHALDKFLGGNQFLPLDLVERGKTGVAIDITLSVLYYLRREDMRMKIYNHN
jgi:hypothetical protein